MTLKRTPLFSNCLEQGGRMVPFAGWEMPVQFSGLLNEHHAVRTNVGMFDISHMGILKITGLKAKSGLQTLIPSDLNRIGPNESCYSVLLNEQGGIIDDLIIYDFGINKNKEEHLMVIINAACFEKDKAWLQKHLSPLGITISNENNNNVFIALQGPHSLSILEKKYNLRLGKLPRFGHRSITINSQESNQSTKLFISRTGYTGEDGFELLMPYQQGQKLWDQLIDEQVTPCGLGARDTLRLEACMHLFGHELNETTSPFEAGLGWLVHLEMPFDFIGREALQEQASKGITKKLIALKLKDRAIGRNGYPVKHNGATVGKITSGTWSPSLNAAIALAYVPLEQSSIGETLGIEIRNQTHPAVVVKKPFYCSS